jgi:O-antigen/teichoic acid export membrane protein
MITVFTGFANLFADFGFASSIIQQKYPSQKNLSTIFWINVFIGLSLTVLIASSSNLIARFYHQPVLKSLTLIISINFLLGSLNIVQKALLKKTMNFRVLAIRDNLSLLIGGMTAIILALNGFGVFSLAVQSVVVTFSGIVLIWTQVEWRPRFLFNLRSVKRSFRFSANLFGVNVSSYWSRNADNLLIGRYFGPDSLALYARGYGLMLLPLRNISSVLGQVMFPALSQIQHDKQKVKDIYLRSIGVIAFVSFPMMLGLFVVSDDFIIGLYGQKWSGVIPFLQIFSLLGLFNSIGTTVGWIFTSQGRTDIAFYFTIIGDSILIIGFIIGILLGDAIYVAIIYAVISLSLVYPSFYFVGKLIDMKFSELINSVKGVFFISLMMMVFIYVLKIFLPATLSHLFSLIILTIAGVVVYLLLVHYIKLKPYLELKEIIKIHFLKGKKI